MRRLIRVLKILGKGILVLTLLSALTLGVLRVVWGRQLAAEIAAIKAKGEPVTVADIPQPQVPDSQNAAPIYEQAFKELPPSDQFSDIMEKVGDALGQDKPSSLARAAELLKPYEHAITLTEKAASVPHCVFPPKGHEEFADRPEVRLRNLASLLGYKARVSAGQGDAGGAVRFIKLQLRMGDCLGKENGLIAFLRRVNSFYIASSTLKKSAAKVTINEAQARELYEAFGRIDVRQMYVNMLQAERAYTNGLLTRDRRTNKLRYTDPLGFVYVEVFMIRDQTALLHTTTQMIDSADLTYREYVSKDIGNEGIPFYAVLARILAPVNSRSFAAYSRPRAQIAGSQIFLALLAFHDRYGSYPQSLDELRAKLGWPLPKDPFTGEEFIYRRQGKGFIIYSLDQDLQDNGGQPFAKYNEPRDIVWTVHR